MDLVQTNCLADDLSEESEYSEIFWNQYSDEYLQFINSYTNDEF